MEEIIATIIANKKSVVLKDNDTINQAIRSMDNNNVGCVLVANSDGDCHAILTDRDIAISFGREECSLESPIKDIMSEPLIYLVRGENDTVEMLIEKMIENGIRRIPIVSFQTNNRKHLEGIVSIDDLILHNQISVNRLADIIEAQNMGPARKRQRELARHKEERKQQTYSRFQKDFMDSVKLDKVQSEKVMLKLLQLLCTRITPVEAFDFISQLPSALHNELLDEKAGPEKSITERTFIDETMAILGSDETRAREVIEDFWHCLERHVSEGELEDVLGQLPKNTRELFKKGA